MSTVKYYLSNRQEKELVGRHTRLVIALPSPIDTAESEDPLAFARAHLPEVAPRLFDRAEWTVRAVAPSRSGVGLTALLGRILGRDEAPHHWHLTVEVCLVWLGPDVGYGSGHEHAVPVWPCKAEFKGHTIGAAP